MLSYVIYYDHYMARKPASCDCLHTISDNYSLHVSNYYIATDPEDSYLVAVLCVTHNNYFHLAIVFKVKL